MPFKFDIQSLPLNTPAFIYDECSIIDVLTKLKDMAEISGCKVLFSLKSFAMIDALRLMTPMLDGFAASSLFEAQLARDLLCDQGTVHITTPGLRPDEVNDLVEVCDYISFNSLSQWNRFSRCTNGKVKFGLRVNPQLSFLTDDRYNPCRSNSKLGIPMSALVASLTNHVERFRCLTGVHFHTHCESSSLAPLLATVEHLETQLGKLLGNLEWINLGGGYLYDEISALGPFYQAVEMLKRKYGLEVFVEPGEAIVGNAGYIVSSVVDLFESEGKMLAILDTSINHIPSAFDYQCPPSVLYSNQSGRYVYLLAGTTCLAGDLFGEYRFDTPLEIGSKVTFECVGGYSLVKANMFNGINLPDIYALNNQRELVLKKQYTIKDYISRWEST
jgi:carboxynorspermidine decarboxylase